MTRLLEFIVALILVFIAAVIVGLFLPSHGHIQRSLSISHDFHQTYDLLNNFNRFPDYAGPVLKAEDPGVKIDVVNPVYGPGAKVSWSGEDGNATLTNKSGHLDPAGSGQIVWDMDGSWRGFNKVFTLDMVPSNNQRLTELTWSYDVDYGWNLIDRYSQFFLRGSPDSLIQYSLNNLQNTLAAIPNVDYTKTPTRIVQTQPTPILFVSTSAPRTLDDVDAATAKAMGQIDAAMKKLGVHQAGPRTLITTDYGDQNYAFDVAVPIDTNTLTVNGQAHDLTQLPPPPAASFSNPAAASSAPAPASTAGNPAAQPAGPAPGSLDKKNQLVVDGAVRAAMLPGGPALEADWQGTAAGIPLLRLALKAFAESHGYAYNDTAHRYYDELVSPPNVAYDQQQFRVFLPLQGKVPQQTPAQLAGQVPPLPPLNPAAWSGAAPQAANAPAAGQGKKAEPKKKARRGRH